MEDIKDCECLNLGNTFRKAVRFNKPNSKGETLYVEIQRCEGHGPRSLPHLWFKNGFTDKEINKYLICSNEVFNKAGEFYRRGYNPQSSENHQINFEWLLEDTDENVQKLIDEVARRFYEEV